MFGFFKKSKREEVKEDKMPEVNEKTMAILKEMEAYVDSVGDSYLVDHPAEVADKLEEFERRIKETGAKDEMTEVSLEAVRAMIAQLRAADEMYKLVLTIGGNDSCGWLN